MVELKINNKVGITLAEIRGYSMYSGIQCAHKSDCHMQMVTKEYLALGDSVTLETDVHTIEPADPYRPVLRGKADYQELSV